MRITCDIFHVKNLSCRTLVVPVAEDGFGDRAVVALDHLLQGQISGLKQGKFFEGKKLTRFGFVPHPKQKFAAVNLIGIGRAKEVSLHTLRRAGGLAAQFSSEGETLIVVPDRLPKALTMDLVGQALVEGFILGSYRDLRFRSDAPKGGVRPAALRLLTTESRAVERLRAGAKKGAILAQLQNECRDLSGAPGNHLTPTRLAAEAKKLAGQHGLKVSVLGRPQIEKLKMGAFLAVAKGSIEPPQLIRLDYAPKRRNAKRVILVGKGITFDTGGISIKPAENMFEMRQDMTGAAVVMCVVAALAELKAEIAVTAFIPTCENMPGAAAYKPGDVVTTSIGKTIEIINTDAEGRLLLADVLGYASKLRPDYLIDVATLTGAATVALGNAGAAILATSERLVEKFNMASDQTGEKIWRLPLWEDYEANIKSNIADMINSAGRPAGTIIAALILKKFTGELPWLHLDIAAVDYEYRGNEITPKGPSGFGVRTVAEALLSL